MVAILNAGMVGTPVNGRDAGAANIAGNISYAAGESPATEAGVVGPVTLGRHAVPAGEMGSHPPLGGNVATYTGLSGPVIDVIDGFSITWNRNGIIETYTLGPEAFAELTPSSSLLDLAAVINRIGNGISASRDSAGRLQILSPFLTSLTDVHLTSSTGLPYALTTVDITGVSDAEAGAVDSFAIRLNGVPLDTSSLDFAAIDDRAALAAALDLLPSIAVTESADNGGTITITLESDGPHAVTGISLADLTPNPAVATFGAGTLAALDAQVAAAEAFALSLNGTALDLAALDFGAIDDAAQLAAALDAIDGIAAVLAGASIVITSDLVGPGTAFGDLALIDNEGAAAAHATVTIENLADYAAMVSGFTLSLNGVPVDTAVVDFTAVTDGPSLAAQLDRIAGIDVAWSGALNGALIITASTIGAAVFSNVTLTRLNMLVGDPVLGDTIGAFPVGTWVMGLGGDDRLTGGAGDDRLDGGEGNDRLLASGAPDELLGGDGGDRLTGRAGDTLDGGAGDDLIIIDGAPAALSGGAGEDTVRIVAGMLVPDAAEVERFEVATTGSTADFSASSRAARVWITADAGASVIGSAFDDALAGGHGDDTLEGGDGTDTAAFTGTRAQYRIERLSDGDIRVIDLRVGLPDGTDTVRQVEYFSFADGILDAAAVLNDPPTGIVVVLGDAVEDQTLTVDTAALADQDGLGAFRFQWQRDGGSGFVTIGTGEARYTLGDDDVGATIRVLVGYTDLNGTAEQVASDATGAVANVNDAPAVLAPAGTIAVAEGATAIMAIAAIDPDGTAPAFSIAGGDDAALFVIDAANGALAFVAAPDFERPADHDRDNSYRVIVRASDGAAFDDCAIIIAVVDVAEAPPATEITGSPGDDSITPPSGSSRIIGGAGDDTIMFDFKLTDAAISFMDGTVTVAFGATYVVLSGFETYVFADGRVRTDDGAALVDDLFYYARYHDVWAAQVDADVHYAEFGRREGREPNALLDPAGYLAHYQDVAAAGADPFEHYDTFGWREGRDPSAGFDTSSYRAAYADVAAAGVDPLLHYLQFGVHEGRSAFADGAWG